MLDSRNLLCRERQVPVRSDIALVYLRNLRGFQHDRQ